MKRKVKLAHHVVAPPSPCPHCGKVMDAAAGYDNGRSPYPGAFAVCLQCGEINEYDANLRLIKADPMKALEVQLDQGERGDIYKAAQRVVRQRQRPLGVSIAVLIRKKPE